MPLSVLVSSTTGATSTNPNGTLPTGISNGSTVYMVLPVSGSVLPTLTSTGWTVEQAPVSHTTAGDAWLLSKAVGAADSGAAWSFTLSNSQRWAAAVAVVNSVSDVTTVRNQLTSLTASLVSGAIVPATNDDLDLLLIGLLGGSATGGSTVTPPAGFTEDVDINSATGTGNDVGAYIAHRQLTGQSGVSQGAVTATASQTNRAYVFRVLVKPASNLAPTANAGPDQGPLEPYTTCTLTGAGSTDSDGTIASYAWSQTGGGAVTLSSNTAASPTFTVPATVSGDTLTFSLTVTDNLGATSTADTVVVTAAPHTFFRLESGGPSPVRITQL